MTFIAFKGATRYEVQIGAFWFTILRPFCICRRNLRSLVCFGWERNTMKSNIEYTNSKDKRVILKASGFPREFPNTEAAKQYIRNHPYLLQDPKPVEAENGE